MLKLFPNRCCGIKLMTSVFLKLCLQPCVSVGLSMFAYSCARVSNGVSVSLFNPPEKDTEIMAFMQLHFMNAHFYLFCVNQTILVFTLFAFQTDTNFDSNFCLSCKLFLSVCIFLPFWLTESHRDLGFVRDYLSNQGSNKVSVPEG